jgi:hypothetical protein
MKKFILVFALLVTASNLAVGVAYAAVCKSSGGARSCGTSCTPNADGSCTCSGACSKEEMDWVAGAGTKVAVMESEAVY